MLWYYKLLLYLKKGQRWTDEFNCLLFIDEDHLTSLVFQFQNFFK